MKFKPHKKIVDQEGRETFAHLHHGERILTRRDMLATGLLPFAARLTPPSLMTLLASSGVSEAQEAVCPVGNTSGLVPIITLNLAGGAALSANWVPLDQGLQPLPSYNKMGLGVGSTLTLDRSLGGAPFAGGNISQILTGIKATAINALPLTAFVGVPVQSQDDSSINKFDISGIIAKAGYQGAFLPNLGSRNSLTGNNNSFAFFQPPSPVPVRNQTDIEGAIGIKGSMAVLNEKQKSQLFHLVKDLNSKQVQQIASYSGGSEMALLVNCASQANHKLSSSKDLDISPLANQMISTVWNINQATNRGSQAFVFASMVYNALLNNSGTVNLEIGGYDYHNGTRTSGNQKDLEAGQAIGRILESAFILQKKVFIVVTSDGSVTSAVSDSTAAPWTSDRGTAGAAYMLAFDPTHKPITSGYQLGYFNKGQGADDKFLTGGSPELAAAAIFANYLSFSKQAGRFEQVLPRVFSTEQLNQVIKIFA